MSKVKKIRITTPATSANLGPGFDFLGIALTKYNVFEFEESDHDQEIGFKGVGNNIVKSCFKKLVKKYGNRDIKVKITMVENGIPVARGLGSSASAIVTGCVAANYFLGNIIDENTLIDEMVKFEGHPDNVLPCFKGGLISTLSNTTYYYKHNVNKDLVFNVLIPNYKVRTGDARKALPKVYSLSDVTFNASRAMLLPKALEDGDIDLIKKVTDDKIHEPYRKPLIKEWSKVEESVKDYDAKLNISGSGPTMLLISKDANNDEIINLIKNLNLKLEIHSLKVSDVGCELFEL